jgi:hypothetical protein
MNRKTHPMGKGLVFGAFAILAFTPAFSQEAPSLPPWLESYPGAKPTIRSSNSLVESSYTIAAQPDDLVAHYRKRFAAAGLPFQPSGDGLGTSIRAEARECDLLIQIRSRSEGTFVKVDCSVKTQSSPSSSPSGIQVITGRPQSTRVGTISGADRMQRHQQIVAEMGIHRERHDAPAPPLVWPSWLVDIRGAAVRTQSGVDQAKDAILTAWYTTNTPMTEIYSFYRDLLNSHEYPARAKMSTGQTISGVLQNALGSVEGSNYPDGAPGAYSVIRVSFDRDVLNGPITVTMRFTTHEYNAKRGY